MSPDSSPGDDQRMTAARIVVAVDDSAAARTALEWFHRPERADRLTSRGR